MNEAEWLVCGNPQLMLEFLRGKVSNRKLRLFLVSVARSVWDKIDREDMRQAVEAGELHADGLMTQEELRGHNSAMYNYVSNPTAEQREWFRGVIHGSAEKLGALKLSLLCVFSEQGLSTIPGPPAYRDGLRLTSQYQPPLLHEIFGNPFRPVTFNPAWRTDTAIALARTMYESREFSAMPILGDALQDAGCDNEDVLNHCRGDGPHVRGCWVVDLVLGKE